MMLASNIRREGDVKTMAEENTAVAEIIIWKMAADAVPA